MQEQDQKEKGLEFVVCPDCSDGVEERRLGLGKGERIKIKLSEFGNLGYITIDGISHLTCTHCGWIQSKESAVEYQKRPKSERKILNEGLEIPCQSCGEDLHG